MMRAAATLHLDLTDALYSLRVLLYIRSRDRHREPYFLSSDIFLRLFFSCCV